MLRFDAPLMSFGGVMVDQHNPTSRFPGLSLMTGLIANALGWRHSDFDALQDLQSRLSYAARWDVPPQPLRDYHTVQLGQDHLRISGWTSRGETEHREGGPDAKFGTHQRYRHYWADGVMTVALTVSDGDPSTERIRAAIEMPARPLFLGRKTCLPATRLTLGLREGTNLLEILRLEPRHERADPAAGEFEACWPPGCADSSAEALQTDQANDLRNWRGQMHAGSRPIVIGQIREVPACT